MPAQCMVGFVMRSWLGSKCRAKPCRKAYSACCASPRRREACLQTRVAACCSHMRRGQAVTQASKPWGVALLPGVCPRAERTVQAVLRGGRMAASRYSKKEIGFSPDLFGDLVAPDRLLHSYEGQSMYLLHSGRTSSGARDAFARRASS